MILRVKQRVFHDLYPITLGNIDLAFYPEGGDLVEGLETKVAFKEFKNLNDEWSNFNNSS